jgi:hypothetical protein
MASEILSVPEESLAEVIRVIRTGLKNAKFISKDTRANLKKWCDEEEAYLKELASED